MVEHCDRCGTELHEDQHRHQQYRLEDPTADSGIVEGRLCSDCFWSLQEWLAEPPKDV